MTEAVSQVDDNYRTLWLAVLGQVKDDIAKAPVGSMIYEQAYAFLTGDGAWTEARAAIASCLEIEPGYIQRQGFKWVYTRRAAEGLPFEQLRASRDSDERPAPL